MVDVVQLARTPDCGSGGREFESPRSPQSQILDFIKRRWKKDSDWCNGNCWWFATILLDRFRGFGLERYYLPIEGHFVVGDGKTFYDWTGVYEPEENPIAWTELRKMDPVWARRIVRDCKM